MDTDVDVTTLYIAMEMGVPSWVPSPGVGNL